MGWKILAIILWPLWLSVVVGAILHYPQVEPGIQFLYVLVAAPCLVTMAHVLYLFTRMCFLNLDEVTDPDGFI